MPYSAQFANTEFEACRMKPAAYLHSFVADFSFLGAGEGGSQAENPKRKSKRKSTAQSGDWGEGGRGDVSQQR